MTDNSYSLRFSRPFQLELLKLLAKYYPDSPEKSEVIELMQSYDIPQNGYAANLVYLFQHGLIERPFIPSSTDDGDDFVFTLHNMVITEKGIDLILDDGGLTAILSVQTIRIHADTMNQLESIISSLDIPEAEKTGLKAKLRELPASVLTQLMNDLSLKAVLSLPSALPLIQKYLQTLFP